MSDSWNAAPAPAGDDTWQPDSAGGAVTDAWNGPSGDNGEFADENISKHAHDEGCRVCGEDGHFARDCPEKQLTGECFNCGEVGHNKADCTNERVEREFTGECNFCGQAGHRAKECPQKPAETCKVCGQEGHLGSECEANRLTLGVESVSAEDAWNTIEVADKEKDVDDLKKALLVYAKAFPEVTFEELEAVFRDSNMNIHLIAKQQEVSDTHTIVNLQGKTDQKYVVSVQFSAKARRLKFKEGWPETPEENLTRLAEAGFVMDRMIPKCGNCGEMGHGSKQCKEERREFEKTVVTCVNCNEPGHRARDCPAPRKSGAKTCKNCGEEGHIAKDCEKPRSAENVECKNCGEMGHFSRDCPTKAPEVCRNCGEEGHRKADCTNERRMQCRNCDEWGHSSRECPQPKDWSRVECTNCHEKGHGKARCPNPPAEPAGDEDGGFGGDSGAGGGGGWDGGNAAASSGGGGWDDTNEAPAAANDGW